MQLRQMLNSNPEQLFESMLRDNQQFKAFVDSNRGKTPEQIAKDYGIDFNQVKSFLK